MSAKNCSACNDLRVYAPDFVINGITDKACESLANDLGVNPDASPQHEDCDDLHDINDCLIGNMDDEVDAFNVCDWKEFMHEYLPNNYETLKAMICSMCGQWERLHDLCTLVGHSLAPSMIGYGTWPAAYPNRRLGTIPTKSGTPNLIVDPNPYSDGDPKKIVWDQMQNAGISYAREEVKACDSDRTKVYEWITPFIHHYKISSKVVIGDCLWYVSKTDLQDMIPWSDSLWDRFVVSSYTWTGSFISTGADNGKFVHYTLINDPAGLGTQYIGLIYSGSSYPSSAPGYDAVVQNDATSPRCYTYTI